MDKLKINIKNIIIWLCFLSSMFIPTSFNGMLFGLWYTVLKWLIALFVIIIMMAYNKINKDRFIISLGLLAYLFVISLAAVLQFDSRFSFAKIVPIVCILLMFSIDFDSCLNRREINAMKIISIIAISILGIGVISHVPIVGDFLINFYSQSYDSATLNAIFKGRPVFTLGVYTRTAFFYTMLFVYFYLSYIVSNSKFDITSCLILCILCVFLTSNSSIVYSCFMFILFARLIKDKPILFVTCLIVIVLGLYESFDYLIEMYERAFASDLNGFKGRYATINTLFSANFDVIFNSLGLGFTIRDDVVNADSGWINFLTMGSLPLMIGVYFLLYKSLNSNIKEHSVLILSVILSFEIVECGMFFDRFIFIYILYLNLIKSINANNLKEAKNVY